MNSQAGTESNARKAKGRRHERADESAGHHKGAAQKSADKCAHRKMGAQTNARKALRIGSLYKLSFTFIYFTSI